MPEALQHYGPPSIHRPSPEAVSLKEIRTRSGIDGNENVYATVSLNGKSEKAVCDEYVDQGRNAFIAVFKGLNVLDSRIPQNGYEPFYETTTAEGRTTMSLSVCHPNGDEFGRYTAEAASHEEARRIVLQKALQDSYRFNVRTTVYPSVALPS